MSGEQVAPETKGVTVKAPETVDLAREVEGLERQRLRMRAFRRSAESRAS